MIEAAADCSKPVMHLFAEAAEFGAKIANIRTGFRNLSADSGDCGQVFRLIADSDSD